MRTIEAGFRAILDLDGKEAGGILPMRAAVEEEEPELQKVSLAPAFAEAERIGHDTLYT